MSAHGHQHGVSFSKEKKNSQFQPDPELKIPADFTHAQSHVHVRFAKCFRKQGRRRLNVSLPFRT